MNECFLIEPDVFWRVGGVGGVGGVGAVGAVGGSYYL